MNNRSFLLRQSLPGGSNAYMLRGAAILGLALALFVGDGRSAYAASAPDWMRALKDAPLPAHDDETNAVQLYAETMLTVQPNGRMKKRWRVAYKILRPDGESYGAVKIYFDAQSRVTFLRAWCIPSMGKDYETKDRDIFESAVIGVDGGELISDTRTKLLRIPAAVPGSIIGYEVEQEQRPYMQMDEWDFQETVPVREARYSLTLPAGWSYKTAWINYSEQVPAQLPKGTMQWTLNNLKPIRIERFMPPWRGIAGRMTIKLTPPNEQSAGPQSWRDIGFWYAKLAHDRRDASPDIKKRTLELTASADSTLAKIKALAAFVQSDIRYVAIELGIGGHQPHRAAEIFQNRYGDCKDKATLLSAMLKEIGVESYYVIINTERGSVTPQTPANLGFNHAILAVALPNDVEDVSLLANITHPKLGKIVFFDPTDSLTPFGRIAGGLQDNYGLVVGPDGGELVGLPKLPASSNSIERTAQLTLDEKGVLRGDVRELWRGDPAATQRAIIMGMTQDIDRVKILESIAGASFGSFEITKATIGNRTVADKPLEWNYSLEAPNYAKAAGDLLLVRPRVIGTKSVGFLETKKPRENTVEFERPQLDKDIFEIEMPKGYRVEDLPPVVNADEGFAAYHSKTEVVGRKLRYTRTIEIRELSVPVEQAEKLKLFYRVIDNDERKVVVLRRVGQ